MRLPLALSLALALLSACNVTVTGAGPGQSPRPAATTTKPATPRPASTPDGPVVPVTFRKIKFQGQGFPYSAAHPGDPTPTGPFILRSEDDLERLGRAWHGKLTLPGVDFAKDEVLAFGWTYSLCDQALLGLHDEGQELTAHIAPSHCSQGDGLGPGGTAIYAFPKQGKPVRGAEAPPAIKAPWRNEARYTVGTAPGPGAPPRAIAVARDGAAWVAHAHEDRVFKLGPDGAPLGDWAIAGQPGRPGFDAAGRAWIPTATGIVRIEPSGQALAPIPVEGGVVAIDFDTDGKAWASTRARDGAIARLMPDGTPFDRITVGTEPRAIVGQGFNMIVIDAEGTYEYTHLDGKVVDDNPFPAVDALVYSVNRKYWLAAPGADALGIYDGSGLRFGEHPLGLAIDGFDFDAKDRTWLVPSGSAAVIRAELVDPLGGPTRPAWTSD